MKVVGICTGAVLGLVALMWILEGNDFFLYKFFAPKQENVRRQVFENTQSYVQGKIQNIGQECFAYRSATGAQKFALAGEIRNEAATIEIAKLPSDEQACVADVRAE